jgi:2-keto-4-pentenoate hydratase
VALAIDGGEVATGTADAAMGDPWAALRWLAGQLAAQGERLQHGDIVITGGLTRAFALEPGTSVVAQVGSGAARLSRA